MRIVVVMFVFIVMCAYFLSVNILHNYVHCLCSLCVTPTFSFDGRKKEFLDLTYYYDY